VLLASYRQAYDWPILKAAMQAIVGPVGNGNRSRSL